MARGRPSHSSALSNSVRPSVSSGLETVARPRLVTPRSTPPGDDGTGREPVLLLQDMA